MDILKSFLLDDTEYNVSIVMQDDEPLFKASDIGDILGIKHIRSTLKDYDEDEKVLKNTSTSGGAQECLFLTECGMYRMLSRSNKPVAKPFQKWVSSILVDIRKKGKYALQATIEETARQYKTSSLQTTHDALISAHKRTCGVYFGLISEKDGKMLIKIGSSSNMPNRGGQLTKQYGTFYFIKIVECPGYTSFERFLHNHHLVKPLLYRESINGQSCATEVFAMTEKELNSVYQIARQNIRKFMDAPTEDEIASRRNEQTIDILKLQLELTKLEQSILDKEPRVECIIPTDDSTFNQVRGDKVQRYSRDGKTLIHTYQGFADVMRDTTLDNPTSKTIRTAITAQTEYKGFRWAFLAREFPDEYVQDIGETQTSRVSLTGMVAMLNPQQTSIVNVFCDQVAAAQDRGIVKCCISTALHRGSKHGGQFWKMWYDCSDDMRADYLSRAVLPEPRVAFNARRIEQLHPYTRDVVCEYTSKSHVMRTIKISRGNLEKALEFEGLSKGYYWRYKTC